MCFHGMVTLRQLVFVGRAIAGSNSKTPSRRSRSLFGYRNRACPVPHRAALGRVTEDGGLELSAAVRCFAVHLDSRRATVRCPSCGKVREFRGMTVFSSKS